MSKKVLGTNSRIITLPDGATAKIDGTGRVIITVPERISSIYSNGTITGAKISIHSLGVLKIDPVNEEERVTLVGVDNTFDDSGFHDWDGNVN